MDRTLEKNLKFVLKATGWKDKKKIDERIMEVLLAVGMERKAHKMPHQLSGGEQQRIAIARSILNEPEVIIADEPTGNLDTETADDILTLLTKINIEKGTAIIMVTHNRQIFEKYPGRVFVCKDEKCIEQTYESSSNSEIAI
jgi:cell division transport system ATP-binding protein